MQIITIVIKTTREVLMSTAASLQTPPEMSCDRWAPPKLSFNHQA